MILLPFLSLLSIVLTLHTYEFSEELHAEDKDEINNSVKRLIEMMEKRDVKNMVATCTSTPDQSNSEDEGLILKAFEQLAELNPDLRLNEFNNGKITKEKNSNFPNLKIAVGDTIDLLKAYSDRIDLLYLSSNNQKNFETSEPCVQQLREVMAAYNKLHMGSVVIVDGCGPKRSEKCSLAKLYLTQLNWTIVSKTPQLIMVPSDKALL